MKNIILILIGFLICINSFGQSPRQFSDFPEETSPANTDVVITSDGSINEKVQLVNLVATDAVKPGDIHSSTAGDGIGIGIGGVLEVNVDNSYTEITGDNVTIVDRSIDSLKLGLQSVYIRHLGDSVINYFIKSPGDNEFIYLGDGNDVSHVFNAVNYVLTFNGDYILYADGGSTRAADFTVNGQSFYYIGDKKLETTTTGVTITGSPNITGLTANRLIKDNGSVLASTSVVIGDADLSGLESVTTDTVFFDATNYMRVHSNNHLLVNSPTGADFLHDVTLQNNQLNFGNSSYYLHRNTGAGDSLFYNLNGTDINLLEPSSNLSLTGIPDSSILIEDGDSLYGQSGFTFSKSVGKMYVDFIELAGTLFMGNGGSVKVGAVPMFNTYSGDSMIFWANKMILQDRNAGSVVYLGDDKEIATDPNLTYNGSTLTALVVTGTSAVTSGGNFSSAGTYTWTPDPDTKFDNSPNTIYGVTGNDTAITIETKKVTINDTAQFDGNSYFNDTVNIDATMLMNDTIIAGSNSSWLFKAYASGQTGDNFGYISTLNKTSNQVIRLGSGGLTGSDGFDSYLDVDQNGLTFNTGNSLSGYRTFYFGLQDFYLRDSLIFYDWSADTLVISDLVNFDLTNDSSTINGKFTSEYYIGQLYVDGDSLIVLSNAADSTYRQWNASYPLLSISENLTLTDSSIVIPASGSGYYDVSFGGSFSTSTSNVTVIGKLFIDDVDTGLHFRRKIGTAGDIGSATAQADIWMSGGEVLTMKLLLTGAGSGTFDAEAMTFRAHRIN